MDAEPKKSKVVPWLIGCSIAIVVVGALCVGGSWFAFNAFVDKAIEVGHQELTRMVEESQLPEEQIASMTHDLDRLRDAAIDRKIELANLEGLDSEFERVLSLGVVQWYSVEVLGSTDLPEEERASARRTMERFARAIHEEKLDIDDVDLEVKVDEHTTETGYDVDQVRRDVERVKARVDGAGIPDEPFQADVALEFTRLTDGILGESR